RRLARLIRRLGRAGEDTLYIGDQTADADAARAAGAHFGAAGWGYATRAALASTKPEWSFAKVADLLLLAGEAPTLRPMVADDAQAVSGLMRALAEEDGGADSLRASAGSLRDDGPGA